MTALKAADTARFKGVIPTLATPFTVNGDLDEARVGQLISWYLSCGVHGICVAGSQGEFFSLEENEHIRLLELAAEAVGGRVPLYAGSGGVTTRKAIRVTHAAEAIGVDLALVITPYFIQPNQAELIQHYKAVADATSLPVMLYNNPPRTSVNILPETLAQCMAVATNIVGIKDSSGDVTQSLEYKLHTDGRALLFSGRDTIALSLFVQGGEGTISPAANVFPGLMVEMYDAVMGGDIAQATRISNILSPLRAAWAWGSFPVVIKEAMALIGQDAGPTRAPIGALSPSRRKSLEKVIAAIQTASK